MYIGQTCSTHMWTKGWAILLTCLTLAACQSGSSSSPGPTSSSQTAVSQQETPKPEVVDLGAGFVPVGVSEAGTVVGNVYNGGNSSAVLRDPSGQTTNLPGLNGSIRTSISAISPSGIIVGNSAGRPVVWKSGQVSDLGGPAAAVAAVNDNGDAAGYVLAADPRGCPVQGTPAAWFGGKYTPLTGAGSAIAIGINNRRQVLLHQFGGPHCWFNGALALWDNGSLKSLSGTFPGAYYAALNDNGMIVGGPSAKVLDPDGTVVELGRIAGADSSEAKAVNSYGETVGVLNDNGGEAGGGITDQSRAYIWDGGAGVTDLNSVVPNSGWVLQDALGIDNSAAEHIVGTGQFKGQSHGFLLSLNRVPRYVALGDSFSSGEGAPDNPLVWAGGWVDGTNTDTDKCHRSDLSYPFLLARTSLVPRPFRSFACSGAWAYDPNGKRGMLDVYQTEPPQPNQLGPDTKLVTLTAGGNDSGFGEVAAACFWNEVFRKLGLPGSLTVPPVLEPSISNDVRIWLQPVISIPWGHQAISEMMADQVLTCTSSKTQGHIASVGTHLDRLYTEIRRKAPYARVLVLLYPNLLPDTVPSTTSGSFCSLVFNQPINGKGGLWWMNHLQQSVNAQVIAAVKRHPGFEFVQGSDTVFTGHDMCQPTGRYVNIPTMDFTGVSQPTNSRDLKEALGKAVSSNSGSVHPTTDGQQAMEKVVETQLRLHPLS